MDHFTRAPSSTAKLGSQNQQGPQHAQQGSRSGSSFSQPQAAQSMPSYSQNNSFQAGSSYNQATNQSTGPYTQGPGAQTVTPFAQNQVQGQIRTQSSQQEQNQATGGQASNLGLKLSSGEQRPPSISRRKYIRWSMINNQEEEDTETLVLTDPKSSLFVDVRLRKKTLQKVTPNNHAQLEPEQIDWAFAGHTISTTLGRDKAPYHRQVVFKHWIDSRSLHPEDIIDNAYMTSPNDGTDDEIEVGSMVNPHTGDKQGYEERWAEEDVLPAAGQDARLCIAMTTEQSDGTRGSVMVLGQWAQGIMRTGHGTLHIERWFSPPATTSGSSQFGAPGQTGQSNPNIYPSPQLSHVGVLDDQNDGWQLVARVGVPILPGPASFVNQDLSEGMICSISGMQWRVRAARRW